MEALEKMEMKNGWKELEPNRLTPPGLHVQRPQNLREETEQQKTGGPQC
jgi:hypothetical protein